MRDRETEWALEAAMKTQKPFLHLGHICTLYNSHICVCMCKFVYAKEIERHTMIFGEIIFFSFCVFVCLYLSVCVYVCKEDCAQE